MEPRMKLLEALKTLWLVIQNRRSKIKNRYNALAMSFWDFGRFLASVACEKCPTVEVSFKFLFKFLNRLFGWRAERC
jgi:hypothetical protein